MSREVATRSLLSVVAACALALNGALLVVPSKTIAAAATPAPRTTLRVGMWTLWHDREIILTPAKQGRGYTLRSCGQCAAIKLSKPATVQADGDVLTLEGAGHGGRVDRLWLTGTVTLAAHGETVTLQNPVEITAHKS